MITLEDLANKMLWVGAGLCNLSSIVSLLLSIYLLVDRMRLHKRLDRQETVIMEHAAEIQKIKDSVDFRQVRKMILDEKARADGYEKMYFGLREVVAREKANGNGDHA